MMTMLSGMSLCAGFCSFSTAEPLPLTVLARFPALKELVHRTCISPCVADHRHDKGADYSMIGQCFLVSHRPNNFSFVFGQSRVDLAVVGGGINNIDILAIFLLSR